jgi:sulfur carrier protein
MSALGLEGRSGGARIRVALDGNPREIDAGMTLAALVAELGFAAAAVGTAVNGRFVARAARDGLELRSGDSVMLFQPIAGG